MRALESASGNATPVPSERRFSLPPPYTGRARSAPQTPLAGPSSHIAQAVTPSVVISAPEGVVDPAPVATLAAVDSRRRSTPPLPPRTVSDLHAIQQDAATQVLRLELRLESWRSFDRGMEGLKRFLALREGEKGPNDERERATL